MAKCWKGPLPDTQGCCGCVLARRCRMADIAALGVDSERCCWAQYWRKAIRSSMAGCWSQLSQAAPRVLRNVTNLRNADCWLLCVDELMEPERN